MFVLFQYKTFKIHISMHALNWWKGSIFLGSEVVSRILEFARDDISMLRFPERFCILTNQDIFCFYLEHDLHYNMFVLAKCVFLVCHRRKFHVVAFCIEEMFSCFMFMSCNEKKVIIHKQQLKGYLNRNKF